MDTDSPALHIRLLKLREKIGGGFGWVVAGFLCLLLLGIVGIFPYMIVGQGIGIWRMATWTGQTTGIVESVSITHGRRTSSAHITYSYKVGEKTYTGDKVGAEWEWVSSSETNGGSVARNFQHGQSIVVHYNTDHPEQAFLWLKIRNFLLCIPAAFLFIILGILNRGRKYSTSLKTVALCALRGLCAGGLALLFLAPTYIEPWIAGGVFGGGAVCGAIWGLTQRRVMESEVVKKFRKQN